MFKLVFEKMESILSHDDLAYRIKNLTLKNAKQNKHGFLEENQNFKSSGIRQKGESQNRYSKKTKHAKTSDKQTFLTP